MASITAAQVALLKTKYLNKIGSDRGEFVIPVVNDVLALYANSFINDAIKNIKKSGSTSTGTMEADLKFNVVKTGTAYQINIGYDPSSPAAEYYDFINKGVAGMGKTLNSPYSFKTKYPSRKMVTGIENWLGNAKIRNVNEDQKKGKSKLQRKRKSLSDIKKNMAYAVAMSIKKKGIKQTRFFDDAITSTFNNNFLNVVGKALNADISIKILQYGNNN